MSMVRGKIVRTSEVESLYVDLGTRDSKGREMGATIQTWRADILADDSTGSICTNVNASMLGRGLYGMATIPTRNGSGFGAFHADRFFKTEAERDEAIRKYITSKIA